MRRKKNYLQMRLLLWCISQRCAHACSGNTRSQYIGTATETTGGPAGDSERILHLHLHGGLLLSLSGSGSCLSCRARIHAAVDVDAHGSSSLGGVGCVSCNAAGVGHLDHVMLVGTARNIQA